MISLVFFDENFRRKKWRLDDKNKMIFSPIFYLSCAIRKYAKKSLDQWFPTGVIFHTGVFYEGVKGTMD
jgi:hypothetical protein